MPAGFSGLPPNPTFPPMERSLELNALVAPLRADVVSGAAVVGRTAAEVVRRAVVRVPAASLDELREALGELVVAILDAQPAMAPLVGLSRDVLEAVAGAKGVEDGRRAAARAAEDFRGGLDERTRAVGRKTARALPDGATVLTISSSSTVRAALLEARDAGLRVICLESRPMSEGRVLAARLAENDLEVTFAVDAAAESLMPEADVVLLGADSVGDRGVVNKIGSRALVESAKRHAIPILVPTDLTKLLPPGFPQPTDDDRPGEEVWRGPAGVRIWNRYFEAFPLRSVQAVVTEEGEHSPSEVARLRSALTVPEELRAWAESRGSG